MALSYGCAGRSTALLGGLRQGKRGSANTFMPGVRAHGLARPPRDIAPTTAARSRSPRVRRLADVRRTVRRFATAPPDRLALDVVSVANSDRRPAAAGHRPHGHGHAGGQEDGGRDEENGTPLGLPPALSPQPTRNSTHTDACTAHIPQRRIQQQHREHSIETTHARAYTHQHPRPGDPQEE